MRTEDGYIIYKCLNGEPAAFSFLVDKYKASVFAFAYYRLRNFHDAEDVTQEVFVKAYKGLHKLRRWDSFLAWIYSITSNVCKNLIRSRSRQPDHEFIEDQESETLNSISSDQYRQELDYDSIHDALDSLPEMYRQALTLRYLGGMSSFEIARFVGASPDAIRKRLSKAHSLLKKEILNTMSATFEEQKLGAIFTFRIVEIIKHVNIQPVPRVLKIPFCLSMATGIIMAVLNFGLDRNVTNHMDGFVGSQFSGETKVSGVREIPVSILKMSQIPGVANTRMTGEKSELKKLQSVELTTSDGKKVKFSEKPIMRVSKGTVKQVAYSPDSKLVATACNDGIWLYDANNLNEVGFFKGHTGGARSVVFSPDGEFLVSGGGLHDDTIRIWDVQRQKQVGLLHHTRMVSSLSFSPDGKLLASSSWDRTIKLWDFVQRKLIGVLIGHSDAVESIAFCPDGELLASGGYDYAIRLWDVAKQEQIGVLKHGGESVSSIAVNPDGKILASTGWDNVIRIWDVEQQKQIGLMQGHKDLVESIVFSPDGKLLASGGIDTVIRIWDAAEQKQIGELKGNTTPIHSITFSPDSRRLASGSQDGALLIWEMNLNP